MMRDWNEYPKDFETYPKEIKISREDLETFHGQIVDSDWYTFYERTMDFINESVNDFVSIPKDNDDE